MKINPITMISNNIYKVNFKAQNKEDEYVYVPLIWDNENYDSVEINNPTYQNQDATRPNGVPSENPQSDKSSSRFKKFAKGAAGTVGTITLVPAGIEKVAKTVENTVTTTKDSINNTVDSIAEIKEHARTVFHKDKPSHETETDNSTDNTESLLAGDTPVQDHHDFDRIHHEQDDNINIIHDHDDNDDFEDSHHEDTEFETFEG